MSVYVIYWMSHRYEGMVSSEIFGDSGGPRTISFGGWRIMVYGEQEVMIDRVQDRRCQKTIWGGLALSIIGAYWQRTDPKITRGRQTN